MDFIKICYGIQEIVFLVAIILNVIIVFKYCLIRVELKLVKLNVFLASLEWFFSIINAFQ